MPTAWFLTVYGAVYGAVFAAELVGDRSLFAISALGARFGMGAVLCGLVPAFMGKALAAVLLGHVVAQLPHALVTWVTVFTFLVSAVLIWRERPAAPALLPSGGEWRRVAPMAFAAVFFTEWADAGQLVTAGLAARYPSPLIVWSAATLALTTKGVLALSVGVGLRRVVPETFMRYGAVAVCLGMGIISAYGIDP